jgi:hypothetical protein
MRRAPPVKLFTAINRFMHRREPQTPATPAPFDDGLVDIARLIEVDDPPAQAPRPADSAQTKPILGANLGTVSDKILKYPTKSET